MATNKAASKRGTTGKAKASTKRNGAPAKLTPKGKAAVAKAAEIIWEVGTPPHDLLRELHEVLLLRCLKEANGNYAAAADRFGPSRQSVQQYANSPLRDARWKPFQQNRRSR